MVQEWDECVLNVRSRELKVVSWEGHELDLASFVQSFHSNVVLVVEISSIERQDVALLVKRLEPSSFLWIDDGVLVELHKHCSVKIRESLRSKLLVVSEPTLLVLVVKGWQE